MRTDFYEMKTLLIDADILAYKAAARHTKHTEPKAGVYKSSSNGVNAVKDVDLEIEKWVNRLDADKVDLCLTSKENFRKGVLPTYKGNRTGSATPKCLDYVKAHLKATYTTHEIPGLEGDDLLGIFMTGDERIQGEKVIVSIDKDLRTIPGTLYNPDTDILTVVTQGMADYYHMYQTLRGDPTDGYSGCPGIGEVYAKQILAKVEPGKSYWPLVVEAYETAGKTATDALIQARCARILHNIDYDFETRRVKLWEPK